MSEPSITAIKPMTDADINTLKQQIGRLPTNVIDEIYGSGKIIDKFKHTLYELVNMVLDLLKAEEVAKKIDNTHDIVQIDGLFRIIKVVPADEIFLRCIDKFWVAKQKILAKDASWFVNQNYNTLIKRDHNQVMIETLVSIIKNRIITLTDKQKELYWNYMFKFLECIASFKKLML